jgi:hypothetical protein
MKNHRLKSALLALIGLALVAPSAGASTITVTNGDLLLGVEATSGTGSAYDYEVDLGQFTTFTAVAPGGSLDLSSLVLNSDITGTGGSGGFGSNTNDIFSVVGSTGDGTGTGQVIGTALSGTTFYTSTTLYTAQTSSSTSQTRADINSVGALLNGSTATTTNGKATFINISANAQSYTTEENTSSSQFFSLPLTGTALVNGGTLSLYENNANAALGHTNDAGTLTLLGTFSFANGNDFKFTAAVPEPSTDALMALGGLLLLAVLVKRRHPAVRL